MKSLRKRTNDDILVWLDKALLYSTSYIRMGTHYVLGVQMISYNMNPLRVNMMKRKEPECPMKKVPSKDTRVLGAVTPPRKNYSSNYTIAPAYNKGPYQVISKDNIKDIGK